MIDKIKRIRWEKIYYIFWNSFYFCTSIQGFLKIKNIILSQDFNQLINFIVSINLFYIPLWGIGAIIFGYKRSIKSHVISLITSLIGWYLVFGYVAFYYPSVYMGKEITNNQWIIIFIPLICGMCLPVIIRLLRKIIKSIVLLLKRIYHVLKKLIYAMH